MEVRVMASLKSEEATAGVDEPLLEYMASMVADEIKFITNGESLNEKIGEMIVAYEAAADEAEALAMCNRLYAHMESEGIFGTKAPSVSAKVAPAPSSGAAARKAKRSARRNKEPDATPAAVPAAPASGRAGRKARKAAAAAAPAATPASNTTTDTTTAMPTLQSATVEKAFKDLLPSGLDDDIALQVAGMVADESMGGAMDQPEKLFALIGDILVAHDVTEDEEGALAVCRDLFAALSVEVDPAQASSDAAALALLDQDEDQDDDIRVGDNCEARFAADGNWYPAKVEEVVVVNDEVVYDVLFEDYGNVERVQRHEIRNIIKTFRAAAICIQDAIREDEDKKKRADERRRKALEKTMTPSELKRAKKAQRKVEQKEANARKQRAEKERLKRYDELKHRAAVQEALPLHLEALKRLRSDKQGISFSKDVRIPDVQLLAPDNAELLKGSELKLVQGRRYGLIGRNGVGKTTLLRQLATYQLPDFPRHIKVLHVEQECSTGSDQTVLQAVLSADIERLVLREEERTLLGDDQAPADAATGQASRTAGQASHAQKKGKGKSEDEDRLSEIYDRLNEIGAWEAESRAASILSGLQFSPEMQATKTRDLSGGWRMRVALASALFVNPDLLMLDEPTNHLDFPTVLWLQNYLTNDFKKALIVVSHDRTFLNEVVTDICYFTNKKSLEYYPGDYDSFLKARQDKHKNAKKQYEAQQMRKKHIEEYISNYYAMKKSSAQDNMIGQVESKKKILEKMELLPDPDEETVTSVKITFPDPGVLRVPILVDCKDVFFKYPFASKSADAAADDSDEDEAEALEEQKDDRPWLLNGVSVRIERGSRIGCLGANGTGKSTLIKLMTDVLEANEGQVVRNSNARVSIFAQHHVDTLNLSWTPVEQLQDMFPGTSEVDCRRLLGRYGLGQGWGTMLIGDLSGGQKSRLAFAIITWKQPHLLILDEPTNHLDMETIDDLIEALAEYKGAVLAVSHDQFFLSRTMQEYWAVDGVGKVKQFRTLAECKRFSYK